MILEYFFRQSYGDTNSVKGLPNCGGSLTLSRSYFDHVGYFDETLTYSEDLDMVLRLAAKFPFIYDTMISYGHRWHSQNSYYRHGRKERYRQKAKAIEKSLFENLQSLDPSTATAAFTSLLADYLASEQYCKVLRCGLYGKESLWAIPRLAERAVRTRIASLT
jgi:GT2 family glycosyltransferase